MARRLVLLLAALSLVGCAGVPSSGPTRVVRRVPAEAPDVPEGPAFRRNLLPGPPPGARPADIVSGFLFAQASQDGDHAIARKYLGPGATWNASSPLTVYASPRVGRAVVQGATATVSVSFDVVGTISADGEFRPPVRPAGPVTFRLRNHPGLGWRLTGAPAGVMLSGDDLANLYQRVTLYFPNAARRLVPHHVFLRQSDQPAAAVVRALLAGPRGWIAPAVRTAIPDGTELLDPPTVVDGVVNLNFSREIRRAPQDAVELLVAQLVWTLTEPALAVEAVRIHAEGEVLVVPGRAALREHRRADWGEYDARPFDERLFFVRGGAPHALDVSGQVARIAPLSGVASFAVARTGSHLAAVTAAPGGRSALVLADLSARTPLRRVLTADRITTPTWEPLSGAVWVAASTGGVTQVVSVPVDGAAVTLEAALPGGTVEALRLSPDGSRAGMLVSRGRGGPVLWMARVQRAGSGPPVVAEPRPVTPSVSGISAMTFDGTGQIVIAGTFDGRRTLARFDVDGYALGPLRVQGLPSGVVTALASSAATPPDRVATVAGRMWRRTPGADWAAIAGAGAAATYAG